MDKRIAIFMPEIMDRERMQEFIFDYFKENFNDYIGEVDIQKYATFNQPPERDQIGHWGEGEILIVMDRRISKGEFLFL